MWDSFVGRQIRRCNRNLLWTNVLVFAALLLCLYNSRRYLYNCFFGPFETTTEALAAIKDPTSLCHYFVTVENVEAIDTGFRLIEKRIDKHDKSVKSQTVKAAYFAVPLGAANKLLLVKLPSPTPSKAFTGSLVPIDQDLRTALAAELSPHRLQYDDLFMPYMLDATPFRSAAYWGLGVGLPLGLLAIVNITKAVRRSRDFTKSPILASIGHFGQPAQYIAAIIDEELRRWGNHSPLEGTVLTRSWLLRESFFGLDVVNLNDVVWIYRKVTKHYVNFIPIGRTHAVVICDRHGRRLECNGTEEGVLKLLASLVGRLPWVAAGYSKELETAFEKRPADFVAAIYQRREEYLRRARGVMSEGSW